MDVGNYDIAWRLNALFGRAAFGGEIKVVEMPA
jgi:hypothetical protein